MRAPENSLESFQAAIDAGADAIELDVGEGLVITHSKRERPRHPISLDDALALVAVHDISVLVDLKCPRVERDVADAVRRHDLLDRAFVSSTSAAWLRRVGAAEPRLLRSISYPNDRYRVSRFAWPASVGDACSAAGRALMPFRVPLLLRAAGAGALTLHHRVISGPVVAAARARDARVVAWTVNDPAGVVRLARLGVDGIVTDDPEMALSALATLDSR